MIKDQLQVNLQNIRGLLEKDWDWVMCFDGYERVGKSTLALQTCLLIDPSFEDDGLERVVFKWDELPKVAAQADKKAAVWYDEANLLTRERLKPWNIAMVKALSIVGFRNLFFAFNFPDFWELDPYIKNHRCRTRALVRSFGGVRGFAQFYSARKQAFKSKASGRSIWWDEAFRYRFRSFEDRESYWYDYRQFWREYVRIEVEQKMDLLDGGRISMDEMDQAIRFVLKRQPDRSLRSAARELGIPHSTFHQRVVRLRDAGLLSPT